VPLTPEALARARAHFADHCASCHGNDGRGQTTLGRNMYPKAPDMTLPETQRLSDGELFAIIENGVRLTGMPAWGRPGPEDDAETWELVHFIRHLPRITPDELEEMKALNPKTRKELEEEEAIRRFLAGEQPPPSAETHRH
jgi:mono/diheme cytochrome c family protein